MIVQHEFLGGLALQIVQTLVRRQRFQGSDSKALCLAACEYGRAVSPGKQAGDDINRRISLIPRPSARRLVENAVLMNLSVKAVKKCRGPLRWCRETVPSDHSLPYPIMESKAISRSFLSSDLFEIPDVIQVSERISFSRVSSETLGSIFQGVWLPPCGEILLGLHIFLIFTWASFNGASISSSDMLLEAPSIMGNGLHGSANHQVDVAAFHFIECGIEYQFHNASYAHRAHRSLEGHP